MESINIAELIIALRAELNKVDDRIRDLESSGVSLSAARGLLPGRRKRAVWGGPDTMRRSPLPLPRVRTE
jgi:hypothetical protein